MADAWSNGELIAVALSNLDLNLLVALHALLEERNVTRAGVRIGLSQPAMSAALGRLRRHFHDDLLVRVGNSYELTPMASGLLDPTTVACASIERVFAAQPDFQPATADRTFSVVLSDYALAVLGGALSLALRERAPNVRLDLLQLTPAAVDDSVHTLRTADALLLPHGFLRDHPAIDLYRDRWVCVAWTGNTAVGAELTMEHLAKLPWVVSYHRPNAFTYAARQLSALGIEPRIDLVVENFMALPLLVVGTDRLALIQERLARLWGSSADIRVLPCPYDAVPIVEAMWWHPMHTRDAGHAWLRELFADAGRDISQAARAA
jgi:DNA-binding transcriptional LysR family regulator